MNPLSCGPAYWFHSLSQREAEGNIQSSRQASVELLKDL